MFFGGVECVSGVSTRPSTMTEFLGEKASYLHTLLNNTSMLSAISTPLKRNLEIFYRNIEF